MTLQNNPDGSALGSEGEKWNKAIEEWTKACNAYALDATEANAALNTMENDIFYDWAEGGDHTLDVHLFNFWVTGRAKLVEAAMNAFDAKRVDAPNRDSMDWDDHVTELGNLDNHFVAVAITPNTALGGGHGTGTYWKATGVSSGTEYSGTVPDNEHGRSDGALNGANATVVNVFTLHDEEIDSALESIDWPS